MKKAVRRATPRPVRKAQRVIRHPARSAVRAATPRAVREAQRTAFNAAHPVNTAENALLDGLVDRSSTSRRVRPVSSSVNRARAASWQEALTEKMLPWRRRDRERYDSARTGMAAERGAVRSGSMSRRERAQAALSATAACGDGPAARDAQAMLDILRVEEGECE